MKVFVYWNLHKKLWSVKALEGPDKGRVIAREPYVALRDVSPKVSEAGRQRVLREGRKNVHAGIVGTLFRHQPFRPYVWGASYNTVGYNPRKGPAFVWRDTGADWAGSRTVFCGLDRRVSASGW